MRCSTGLTWSEHVDYLKTQHICIGGESLLGLRQNICIIDKLTTALLQLKSKPTLPPGIQSDLHIMAILYISSGLIKLELQNFSCTEVSIMQQFTPTIMLKTQCSAEVTHSQPVVTS